MQTVNVDTFDNPKGREGGGTNLDTGEGDLLSILTDEERAGMVLVVQHGSELEDLQILVASILHSGNDPQVRHRCDFVGGSRERDLKITSGTNFGMCISTDGGKTKGNKK